MPALRAFSCLVVAPLAIVVDTSRSMIEMLALAAYQRYEVIMRNAVHMSMKFTMRNTSVGLRIPAGRRRYGSSCEIRGSHEMRDYIRMPRCS